MSYVLTFCKNNETFITWNNEIQKELDTNLKKEEREDINATLTKNDEINQ